MNRRIFTLAALAAILAAPNATSQEPAISSRARNLWRRALVIDANIAPPVSSSDLPQPQSVLDEARAGGLAAIKTTMGGADSSFEDTLAEVAFFQRLIEAHPDYFTQIRSADDILAAKRAHQLGIIFSFESAVCLGEHLDRIDLFRNLGIRVMQLSYNKTSPFGAGIMAPPGSTLTPLGREAVSRMNAQGVALDLSHANAATTAAAIEASTKPVLITHAGCAAIHAHPRNKTDDQLRALANKGGVVGIFDLFYLAPSPRQPNLDDYLAHMTHALDLCGEDHVGIGSDTLYTRVDLSPEARAEWDAQTAARQAAGLAAPEEDRMPYTEGLNRPDRTLVIADALLKRGYRESAVEKVLGGNFLRAFREIW